MAGLRKKSIKWLEKAEIAFKEINFEDGILATKLAFIRLDNAKGEYVEARIKLENIEIDIKNTQNQYLKFRYLGQRIILESNFDMDLTLELIIQGILLARSIPIT